jgi:hypothetical protein
MEDSPGLLPEERLAAAARRLSAAAAVRAVTRPADRVATDRVRREALEALAAGMTWRRTADLAQVKLRTLQRWAADTDGTGTGTDDAGAEDEVEDDLPVSVEGLLVDRDVEMRAWYVPEFQGRMGEDGTVAAEPEPHQFVVVLETVGGGAVKAEVVAEGIGETLAEAITRLRLRQDDNGDYGPFEDEPPF